MKADVLLKMIADEAGLVFEGEGGKARAYGKLLGFPVLVHVASLMGVNQLMIGFGATQKVKVNKLRKAVFAIKKKDQFNITDYQEKESFGSIVAGGLGGALGGAIHGAVTAGKKGVEPQVDGAFSLMIVYRKETEDEIIKKYQEIMTALETALKQMEITPPVAVEG